MTDFRALFERACFEPSGVLLVSVGSLDHSRLVKRSASNLHPNGKSGFSEATRHGYGRQSRNVEGSCKASAEDRSGRVVTLEGRGRLGHGWGYQKIYAAQSIGKISSAPLAYSLCLQVIAGFQ